MSLKSNIGHQGGHLIRAADEATNDIHTDGIVNNSNCNSTETATPQLHITSNITAMNHNNNHELTVFYNTELEVATNVMHQHQV